MTVVKRSFADPINILVKSRTGTYRQKEGGIIWHTQGSGKSLTMVWLTKWIREYNPNARVLIVTDRDELDKQIEKVLKALEKIYLDVFQKMAKVEEQYSSKNSTTPNLGCCVHSFTSLATKKKPDKTKDYDSYLKELKIACQRF
jgi:type I restriction enzyme, R subunit